MKSAYELAMERLAKSDPAAGRPLSAEQKDRLAEIDRVYQGKLAEREIFVKKQLNDLEEGRKSNAKRIERVEQRILQAAAVLAFLAFLAPLVAPILAGWLGLPK